MAIFLLVIKSFSLFIRCLLTQINCLELGHKKFWNTRESVNTEFHTKYMLQFSQNTIDDPEAEEPRPLYLLTPKLLAVGDIVIHF